MGGTFDIINDISDNVTLVLFTHKIFNGNHAVSVYGIWSYG